ncbi:MAG: hypothetical protein JNJ61_12980 [Anaerolineae bacterium]|nr:hypothetical protein [Anaerolineae bacterium]
MAVTGDFYAKLVRLIDAGEEQQALDFWDTIQDERERLLLLHQVAASALVTTNIRAIDRDYHLALVHLSSTLQSAFSLDLSHVRDRAIAKQAFDDALARARDRVLAQALDLARACGDANASPRSHAYQQVQFIIKALEKELSAIQMNVKRVRIESPLEPQPDGNGS